MSDSPTASRSFNYNVRWMSRTFNSRTKVESLLGPQQAAGNVSSHDYNATVNFLPGFHRYYGLLLSSAALSAIYILRKPSWSQMRTLSLAAGSAFGSLALGNTLTLKSHYDFVRSLDNPGGFAKAVDYIQKQSGLPLPSSPIIQRMYYVEDPHSNVEDRQDFVPQESSTESSSPSPQTQVPRAETRPLSKWDQIRAANGATTVSSSWDTLRQKHEKSHVQRSDSGTFGQSTSEQVDDRAAAQARFDALLEKERTVGSQDSRK